ncbi:hypothetical protein [Teredinibacter turnerae]|uniref:hypothetical protein n=1 Tax=Teredinibacter turnerae TaxID=2426 RepID=UPI0005A268FE|nr:hypothetical protein [Teredinibacter turnerae]
MDKNKLELERAIFKEIVEAVHDESTRISDSCQRDIIHLVRDRIPEGITKDTLDRKKLRKLVIKFSEQAKENAQAPIDPKKRAVVRSSFLGKIKEFLSDIWPFGE